MIMDKNALFNGAAFKKTTIILDRRSSFSSSSKIFVDLDGGAKSKGSSKSATQGSPLYKSIWTCMVEASVEYCRVVYDLFPCQNLENHSPTLPMKKVRLLVSDATSHFVNSWSDKDQCISQVLKPLAALRSNPVPDSEEGLSIQQALKDALLSFVDTGNQKKRIIGESDSKGRIICLSSIKSENELNRLVDYVSKTLKTISESSKSSSSLSLHFVDLVLVHVPRSGESSKLGEKIFKPMTNLSVSVQIMKASQLVMKMTSLVQRHFNLKSTIVTGIPMKEEQHSGGAMNYDVELFHSADVHYELDMFNIYCTDISGPCELSQREEILKDTVTLKWCTAPKASHANMDLQHCIGTFRFTVAERVIYTSTCLGNNRCPLEDPPSISEGCGGRVTDYRINDFGEFMKSNRLAPLTGPKPKGVIPLEKALSRLERCTRMWPMVISDTLLFNLMSLLEPLSSLIFKEHLTDDDVGECTKVINRLQAMESRNDPLPVTSVGFRGKGPKRDEQYRQLWAEMETFLQSTSTTSKMHAKVLNYLRGDSENDDDNSNGFTPIQPDNDELSRTTQAWKELDNYRSMTERERSDFLSGDKNNDHFYKRSNSNPPMETAPTKKIKSESPSHSGSLPKLNYKTSGPKTSLLSIWCSRMDAIAASRHEEFEGRSSSTGNQAELYADMNGDNHSNSSRSTPVGAEWN